MSNSHAVLLVHCRDKKGILSALTGFLSNHQGNIIDLDEHVEKEDGTFFMRAQWELEGFNIPKDQIETVFVEEIASQYDMSWSLHFLDKKPRMAIFVSKESHCLYDIVSRYYSGEWNIEIAGIFSNHKIHQQVADRYNLPFYHYAINKENKSSIEQQQLKDLKTEHVDFLVLARYMQILSDDFIAHYPNKIINIHHSFLPAFAGAKPYHRAHERGVKIIGATSHYVTADLDAGPIIEQDIVRVTHKDSVVDLVRKGKDLEKIVLSRAIWNHLERKTLVYGNKTVVFD
jgi:formyltetrahydrofolate deformylase